MAGIRFREKTESNVNLRRAINESKASPGPKSRLIVAESTKSKLDISVVVEVVD